MSQTTCCNTCNDVKEAYEKRGWLLTDLDGVEQCAREGVKTLASAEYDPTEGCNVKGYIEVLKLSGKFHLVRHGFALWACAFVFRVVLSALSVHRLGVCRGVGVYLGVCVCFGALMLSGAAFLTASCNGFWMPSPLGVMFLFFFHQQTPGHSVAWKGHNLHDMSVFRNRQLDLSHTIRSLSFGAAYPGQKNPLDGTVKSAPAEQSMGQHEYFIKLVPTTYKKTRGRPLKTNQVCTTQLIFGALSHVLSDACFSFCFGWSMATIVLVQTGVCVVQFFYSCDCPRLSHVVCPPLCSFLCSSVLCNSTL